MLPAGVELPHIAAPDGGDGVPAGEGCYSCNVDAEGIPLQQPRQNRPRYLRVRRSLDTVEVSWEITPAYPIFVNNFSTRALS